MAKRVAEGEVAGLSRRSMLGAGAALPVAFAVSAAASAQPKLHKPHASAEPVRDTGAAAHAHEMPGLEGLETLTAIEMETLESFCARLVPTDERSPGAREARAAYYINRALAGPLMKQRTAYAVGLSALDAYARSAKNQPFAKLTPPDQDAILHALEAGRAPGFTPSSAAFFNLVRSHTIEGMFCDPYYGGNANFVGWDLINYPGLRMMVRPEDQRLVKPKSLRKSAYSVSMFGRGAS